MANFKTIDAKSVDENVFSENVFSMIGDKWMLVTATAPDGSYNTMTASWGGLGVLWNKKVAFVFIRPQRYTAEFSESGDTATLSFFGEEYRKALSFCGSHSGRDCDKIAETGLTPVKGDGGEVYFAEAELVLKCKKLYRDELREGAFVCPELLDNYKNKDFHIVYVYEITEVLKK